MLDQIRIVLIRTSHPGNIGSAARAMKTMGITRLYLVDPRSFPDRKADEMSAGADDVLKQATVVSTLEEAVADCTLVIGTSARERHIQWPMYLPRAMAEKVSQEPAGSSIALVFGSEQSGMTNEELERCHLHIQIPANPDYSSLNLAAAVQVVSYELRMASLQANPVVEVPRELARDERPATHEQLEQLFEHMERAMIKIDFLKINAPRKLMTRLRRFFLRARPDVMEMNIFRGMMTAIEDGRTVSDE